MPPQTAQQLTGQPVVPTTTSLDLPSGLAKMLSMDTFNPAAPMTQPAGLMTSVSPQAMAQTPAAPNSPMLPHYAMGGAVGPGGMPVPPSGGAPGQLPPQMQALAASPQMQQFQSTAPDPSQMHSTVEQQLGQNPQVAQQIRGTIIKALQDGSLTAQELNTAIQLIQAAVNNPSLYPQLRQFAIQQGLAGDDDLPQQYDRGFVTLLLTVAKSAEQLVQGGAAMPQMPGAGAAGMPLPDSGASAVGGAGSGPPMQSMRMGGNVQGGANQPVPILAHEGEYVIPKHVVGMKGREFFDKLVSKYTEGAK